MKSNNLAFRMRSLWLALLASSALAAEQPNIIIFYVDDLGWQDVQLNDVDDPCPYETPNIIKLAESGMNFTQGYASAPSCSPSRAGIITGQHPAKVGMTHVHLGAMKPARKSESLIAPYLPGPLDLNLLTLADALKANGYRTGHSGKWHVGLNAASYGFEVVNQDRGPHRRMEDRTKGFATATDKQYPLSKEKFPPFSDKKPDGISYPYDEVTESAIKFMEESGDQPFFLNLCHWMVHWPVLTRNGELLEYYCDKLGQPFPPEPGDMSLPGQQNPYFAAMVTTVDWSLGRVVNYLENTDDPRNPGKKLIETTYIFFTSDNGGAEKHGKEVISDNAPLKYGKTHTEDGGVRVPMVISGPRVERASQFDGLVSQLDYFPTILELTDSKISWQDARELSGLDITAVLEGQSQQVTNADGEARDHLFWHFPHNGMHSMKSAIRSGDFKLYKRYFTNDYELYQLQKDGLRNDYEEANDLAKNPEYRSVVERLSAQLEAEVVANHAEGPYLNPNYSDKEAPSAVVANSKFSGAIRRASLALERSSPAIEQAYVIYRPEEPGKKTRHRVMVSQPDDAKLAGMRELANVSGDGYSVSAKIPLEIPAYCFVLIDTNGYMQYSEVVSAR